MGLNNPFGTNPLEGHASYLGDLGYVRGLLPGPILLNARYINPLSLQFGQDLLRVIKRVVKMPALVADIGQIAIRHLPMPGGGDRAVSEKR